MCYNFYMEQTTPVRISVSESARLFGVSPKTIRQALKQDEIRYIIARGRYQLNFESVLKWSQESTRRRNLLASTGVGQYVERWKIHNKKYSPNVELINQLNKN